MGKTHELKTLAPYFDEVAAGRKTFEARRNDRSFQEGDTLALREWGPDGYTGRELRARVGFVLTGGNFGVRLGYVVMSLIDVAPWPVPYDDEATEARFLRGSM